MDFKKMLAARTPHWFDIADDGETAEIRIDGIVGESFFDEGVTAKDFIAQLNAVNAKSLVVHINSPGGMVFDGMAIYNALKSANKHIRVVVDGIAASIAAVIAMAGDEIVMPESSYLMVHYPWTCCLGNAENLLSEAENLDSLGKTIEKIFTDRSGCELKIIQDLMHGQPGADGTFISASEALKIGLATEVEENKTQAAACVGLDVYSLIPAALQVKSAKDSAGNPPAEENPESYKTVFSEFLKH